MVHVDRLIPNPVPYMDYAVSAILSQRIITKAYDDDGNVRKFEVKRLAVVNVPSKLNGRLISKAAVTRKLREHKGCRIVRVLANHPILTEAQQAERLLGNVNIDVYARLQLVRYMDGEELHDMHNRPMYRMHFFSTTWQQDRDLRSSNPTDYYQIKV